MAKPKEKPCTLEQAADLDFEASAEWVGFKPPTAAQWPQKTRCHLIAIHIAHKLAVSSKPEVVEMLRNMAKDGEKISAMHETLQDAQEYFAALAALLDGAVARFLVAGSALTLEPDSEASDVARKGAHA